MTFATVQAAAVTQNVSMPLALAVCAGYAVKVQVEQQQAGMRAAVAQAGEA